MKILIYEDWVHYVPTGKGWYAGFSELGHTVYQMGHNHLLTQFDKPLDVVIHFDVPTQPQYLDVLKRFKDQQPNCQVVGLAGPYKPEFEKYLGLIDFWCSMGYNYTKVRKDFELVGFNHYDIPMATDPIIFQRLHSLYQWDFSFFGGFSHGYRGEDYYLMPALDDSSLTRCVGGFGGHPTVGYTQLNYIYNSSRVNLNFHYDSQKEEGFSDFNGRMFDIPASGGFMLCDHPDAKAFFGGFATIGDKENWLDMIHYYKDNETEREEAADKLHKHVLKHHTYRERMKLLANILETNK